MRQLTFIVVLLTCTGLGWAMRNGFSGSSEAARSVPSVERENRAAGVQTPSVLDRPASQRQGPSEGAALSLVSGTREAESGEMVLARIAAECGNHLLEKARKTIDNGQLLHQAAQHYRASLAHDNGSSPLFAEVRGRLAEIEKLQKAAVTEAKPAPAEAKPRPPLVKEAVKVPAPAAAPAPGTGEPLMVGPDGVVIRRAG